MNALASGFEPEIEAACHQSARSYYTGEDLFRN